MIRSFVVLSALCASAMKIVTAIFLGSVLWLLTGFLPDVLQAHEEQGGGPAPVRVLQPVYTETPPQIDGLRDAGLWDPCVPASDFVQIEPQFGEPAHEATRVHVLYTHESVYFLVECDDPEPDLIVSSTMERDADLKSDDAVSLYIDSFHDHRSLFHFSTNPVGARLDQLITSEGREINIDWDGIWFCKSAVTATGWSAEFSIPLAQLRFRLESPITWGLQVERTVRRTREVSIWTPVPASQRQYGPRTPSNFGHVTGFEQLTEKKRDRQIKPFLVTRQSRDYLTASTDRSFEPGLDVKLGVTSTLTADFTANTDFAEVENDDEQVNLTQYSLFFPEKRDFFTEGASLFTFGRPQRMTKSGNIQPPEYLLFYSRRIGLQDNQEVPILGGARMTGRAGAYQIGLMNMVSGREDIQPVAATAYRMPRTNYSAVRVKRDLGARSSAGVMYLDKTSGGFSDYNRAAGFDAELYPSTEWSFKTAVSRTFDSNTDRSHSVAQMHELQYFTGPWHAWARYFGIGRNFNPEMGFARRDNFRSITNHLGLSPRINRWTIRELGLENSYTYETDESGNLTSRLLDLEYTAYSQHGDRFIAQLQRRFERIFTTGQTIQGIALPLGDFNFQNYRVEAMASDGRQFSGLANYVWGDFFNGSQRSFRVETALRLLRRMRLEARFSQDRLTFPGDRVVTNVITNRFIYSFSPDISFKAFTQWNDTERRISVNLLVRYIYKPGSDLFLVYNEFYEDENNIALADRRWHIRNRTAALKVQYTL